MSDYDSWLDKQAEEYNAECVPKAISVHQEYEGCDEDGNIEYSQSYNMNCEACDERDCKFWAEWNDEIKEKV